ncbi:MAG: hypothetical protein ACKOOL_02055 [Novosphingobium sp.]
MKRSIILLAIAALPLSACSGKSKAPDDKASASATATDGAKPNPWASGSPSAAPATSKPEAKATAAAKEDHVNPWAKDPPPNSQPSAAASDKPKEKKAPRPQQAMD